MKKAWILLCSIGLAAGAVLAADYYATKADYRAGILTPGEGEGGNSIDGSNDGWIRLPGSQSMTGDMLGQVVTDEDPASPVAGVVPLVPHGCRNLAEQLDSLISQHPEKTEPVECHLAVTGWVRSSPLGDPHRYGQDVQ